MSPSVGVTTRRRKGADGRTITRYIVRYRVGGKYARPQHVLSAHTRREADACRDWCRAELAAGRIPDLRAHLAAQGNAPTVASVARAWVEGRHDLAENTREKYLLALGRIEEGFARRRISELRPQDVAAWVGGMVSAGVGRSRIERDLSVLRQALDDHLDPNPARHRSVRLPRSTRTEANPPPFSHWQLILDGVSAAVRLPLRMLEGTGLRVGELQALTWGDLDFQHGRLFVRGGKTAAARRWVPVPPRLWADLERLVPRDDRDPDARVFPGLNDSTLRMAMRRVSTSAGIPLYSPHDLRHRYITLLIRQGMDPAAVSARAGHTRRSMTLDVYSHLLLDEEER